GCTERYCSATAIIRMGREACEKNPGCLLSQRCNGDLDKLNAKIIIDAAKEGDTIANSVFNRYAEYLTIAVNNIISFLDPDMIVLGGGVSHAGEFLLNAVRERLPKYLMFKTLPYAELRQAKLGNDAGIIGAALLGIEQ
ncbi:MAG: ROK family protein, partial [Clostridia bacterium]|nr:ROK family protein [Clostridia bacterium]